MFFENLLKNISIIGLMVFLRSVKEDDWKFLIRLRNIRDVRNACNNTSKFSKLEYKKYIFSQLELHKKNIHWVIMHENESIGHAKIINQHVGILIHPDFINRGFGGEVYKLLFIEAKKIKMSKLVVLIKFHLPFAVWAAIKNGWTMKGIEKNSESIPYAYRFESNV